MALESSTTIKGLVASNPVGAADPKRDGDNHIRMIKDVLQRAFPDMDYLIAGKDDSGIANAIQLTFTTTAPSAYAKYMLVYFVAANANTGATTLQINSLGAKSLVEPDGSALAAGRIAAGRSYVAVYDGTKFVLMSPTKATPDEIPSGTKMLFQQTTAPTGWTKDTTHNDKALRIVSGTAGSGGATAFTSVFGSGLTTGSHALTVNEIPGHTHGYTNPVIGADNVPGAGGGTTRPFPSTNAGTTTSTGGGAGHTHTLSLDLQYVDVIVATKD